MPVENSTGLQFRQQQHDHLLHRWLPKLLRGTIHRAVSRLSHVPGLHFNETITAQPSLQAHVSRLEQ